MTPTALRGVGMKAVGLVVALPLISIARTLVVTALSVEPDAPLATGAATAMLVP